MSFSEKEHIDKLFKGLQKESIEADMAQLLDMEKRLNRWHFYRFGWKHFNIYYTGLIALTCIALLWFSIETYSAKQTMQSDHSTLLATPDSVASLVPPSNPPPGTLSSVPASSQNRHSNPAPVVVQDIPPTKKIDSSLIVSEIKESIPQTEVSAVPIKDSLAVKKKVKIKKTVYLSKRDTIVQYDTTKVLKKK